MILGFCMGVAAWILFLAGHIAAVRLARVEHRAKFDQLFFAIGLAVIACWMGWAAAELDESLWTHGGWLMGMAWGVLSYVSLFVLYMPFYYTVAASLSIRTLVILLHQPDGSLPLRVLLQDFSSTEFLKARLDAMATNGILFRDNGSYRLSRKGRIIAMIFMRCKRSWHLGTGG